MSALDDFDPDEEKQREMERKAEEMTGMRDKKTIKDEILQLRLQRIECEDAILCLMKDGRGNDYFFVRGVLEKLIFKIESKVKALDDELASLERTS